MTSRHPTLFVADAHLRGPRDTNQAALVHFLNRQPPAPFGLVVLGDLFDFLAGTNRTAAKAYHPVLEALGRFAPFHYLEGNHDFDLSPRLPGLEAALIHPGPATLTIQGVVFRLLHGDRSGSRDLGTRWLRRTLQSFPLRFARDHLFPDRLVFQLALAFASVSRKHAWPGRADELRTAQLQAQKELRNQEVEVVVYAHTHQPLVERTPDGWIANPGPAVPGGSYLKLAENTLSLHRFPDGRVLPPGPVRLNPRRREPP